MTLLFMRHLFFGNEFCKDRGLNMLISNDVPIRISFGETSSNTCSKIDMHEVFFALDLDMLHFRAGFQP